MKIGILTFHNAYLQCYSLWKYLLDQGYDAEIIDLRRPGAHSDYVPSMKYQRCRPLPKTLLSQLKNKIKELVGIEYRPASYYSEKSKEKFDEFNSLYKKSKPFSNLDEFYNNPPQYDIYIAGSDQLWNPTQPYCIEPYFLTFINGVEKKKISFSTSIGITELTEKEKVMFKTWLSDFSAISVREKQAKQLLDSFVGLEIKQISDPTFLLTSSSWQSIAVYPQLKEPYILYFALHIDEKLKDYCLRLSKESGIRLLVLNQTQPYPKDNSYTAINDAGPREFIGYIEKAQLVITDSFHGTVFSIIMGTKCFYTYIAPGNKRGSRIEDLLGMFSLENHIIRDDFSRTYNELQADAINRQHVLSVIKDEKEKSVNYLKTSIS